MSISGIVNDVSGRIKKGLTAFVYNGSEGFDDVKQQEPPIINQIITALYAIGFIVTIVTLVVAAGAAHLSMCYSSYMGVTDQTSVLLAAAVAFVFFPIYYPYYAFVLNPLCVKGRLRR